MQICPKDKTFLMCKQGSSIYIFFLLARMTSGSEMYLLGVNLYFPVYKLEIYRRTAPSSDNAVGQKTVNVTVVSFKKSCILLPDK